jgi:hypothetical protein
MDPISAIPCHSNDEGDVLILALPDDIEKIDSLGNMKVPIDQRARTKGLCETINKPDF